MNITERKTKIYCGTHDGVDFVINNFLDYEKKSCWTYYLIIRLNRIPEESNPDSYWLKGELDKRGFADYEYMSTPPVCNIYMHGGITYYSKEAGFDGSNRVIKIGCDYQHYWDIERYYDIEDVKKDIINSIESFKEQVPKYKYWCYGNGNLYDLDEGVLKDDSFLSNEYKSSVSK